VQGLEVPRNGSNTKDQILGEMDLDAVIARHPQIALVDETPTPNAARQPAIRSATSDVEELLSHASTSTPRSIFSTSRASTTWSRDHACRVRRDGADSVFDRADAIELIDLTPDDLIQRLKRQGLRPSRPSARWSITFRRVI